MSESFWDLLFGDEKGGYVRVALNSKDKKHFNQEFVEWPNGRTQLERITKAKERGDLYFSPALFKEKDGRKVSLLGSRVGWVDLDRPYQEMEVKPNAIVASGTPGRSHLYFQLPTLFPTEAVETYNRYLCKEFGGDNSGWDANQLLRVPDTLNFKTDPPKPVKLLKLDPSQHWQIPKLDEISEPSEPLQLEGADLNETLLSSKLTGRIRQLLTQHPIECFDRSSSLFFLGRLCSEAGFEQSEIYTLLEYADSKWGKFSQRDDKQLRLIELVSRVSQGQFSASFPSFTEPTERESELSPRPIGIFSLRKQTPPANWVVDQILREKGQTLIGGPTNIGKSPLAMSLAMSIAMGSADWMGFKINSQDERILFSALEMDGSEISEQVGPMLDMAKTPDNEARLEERLHILPVGHSIAADLKDGQEFYEALLEEHAYTGLILDTIGASVSTSLSEEKPMRAIVDWLARIRKRFGCWVVVLSHPRKDPAGSKWRDKEMDDFYGSRLIGDRSNVALIMDKGRNHPLILTNKKARFGKVGNTLLLNRMANGWYSVVGEKEAADFRASVPNLQPTSNEDAVDVDNPNEGMF